MVNKLFSIRRVRTSIVFTCIAIMFVLLYVAFFKDDGGNIETRKKIALKNQNVVNLKEITKNMNDPLNKSKNSEEINELIKEVVNEDGNESPDNQKDNQKENENENNKDNLENNSDIDNEDEENFKEIYDYVEEKQEENEQSKENEDIFGMSEEMMMMEDDETKNEMLEEKKEEEEEEIKGDDKTKQEEEVKEDDETKQEEDEELFKEIENSNDDPKIDEKEKQSINDSSENNNNNNNNKPKPTTKTLPEIKRDSFYEKTYFKLYHDGINYRDRDDPKGEECPVAWTWVDDKESSDIIVLNVLDNLGDIMRIENYHYNKNNQKLLLMSMESTSNYYSMIQKKDYFDYMIDYRLDSDVPIPYTYSFFNFYKKPLPTKEKGKDGRGLAAAFISNCFARNERLEYLRELMKYTKIDSFGMCEHNKEVYEEDDDQTSWNTKMNTIRKYKFTLAFENSNDRDYVTEKFFQPLEAGSVPVFYGTSNIADFAPDHSYINANDFGSAKELAEYLEFLDKNDDAYEEYLAWKKDGNLGDNLEHLIEIRKLNSICQLLQRIKELWINPYLTIWNRNDVPKKERACRLC